MSGHCIRTGFTFRSPRGPTFVGDLFFHHGAFQIRGVPRGERRGDSGVDAIIGMTALRLRTDGGRFMDSPIGVQLLGVSPRFRAHITEWHPEALDALPNASIEAVDR